MSGENRDRCLHSRGTRVGCSAWISPPRPSGYLRPTRGASSSAGLMRKPIRRPLWQQPEAHDGWIRGLAVSPDGKQVATAGNDKTRAVVVGRRWQTAEGELKHPERVFSIAYHPDGEVAGDRRFEGRRFGIGISAGKTVEAHAWMRDCSISCPEFRSAAARGCSRSMEPAAISPVRGRRTPRRVRHRHALRVGLRLGIRQTRPRDADGRHARRLRLRCPLSSRRAL